MMYNFRGFILAGILACSFTACKEKQEEANDDQPAADTAALTQVRFNADSAYAYVAKQVDFGPRVPGTKAQRDCAAWMQAKLREFCDTVYRQETTVTAGDKKPLPCINLIGSINPSASRRILLLTHWDSRPWADKDTKDQNKPVLAADDGGSGVGVLLELARSLKSNPLPAGLGIDILLTDVEDYGKSEWGDASYCLGTQYWAKNPHMPGYKATYGILLDMVGGRDSRFPMEQSSTFYARDIQQRVWASASRAGYSSFFSYNQGAGVTDDHKFVNELTGIPTIDIIALTQDANNPFVPHWHTHNDNMSIIDKATLQAVGQTLLQTLFEEGAAL